MKQRNVILLALAAILLWSTAGTAFKLALKGMDFLQLLFVASTVAWIVLLGIVLARRQAALLFKNARRGLPRSMLLGFLNPFLYYLILLKAYSLLPAQIAQPLNYTWPVVLVLLSVPFLKHRLRWIELFAILVSFAGVVLISSQGENILKTPINEPFGVFLAVVSSVVWASYWILNVKDERPELIKLTLNFFFGSLFSGILLFSVSSLPSFSISLIPAFYVGLTEMAIAFACWLTALENSPLSNVRISNLVYISPFLALLFIHLILGEQIYWTTPAGLVLIVAGILVQQLLPAKTPTNGT
ncbi:MAG: DMT family transporter [Bacteroidales bacterium]